MPLRWMDGTSLQLTRMEVELSVVTLMLLGGLEGAVRRIIINIKNTRYIRIKHYHPPGSED